MKVVFRVDASLLIGTGHVMRCLTLARALAKQRYECFFICRAHNGHLIELIVSQGFKVFTLPLREHQPSCKCNSNLAHAHWLDSCQCEDSKELEPILANIRPKWLIVDHYALDIRWQEALRPYCHRIMVIDDLADRRHDCDLLLDQTYGRTCVDYKGLVSHSATLLCGSTYALLRPEFTNWREFSLRRRQTDEANRLIINLGGVDQANLTSKLLRGLLKCALPGTWSITVVMGKLSPWINEVMSLAMTMPWKTEVMVDVTNMAELMAANDFAIGAAGSTSWERCSLGLPTIMVVAAENQRLIAQQLTKAGAAFTLDANFGALTLCSAIERICHKEVLHEMSKAASNIVDGRGLSRTLRYLEN